MYDYKINGNFIYVTENYKKVYHKFNNVCVIKGPYSSHNKWYIQVKPSNEDIQYIELFEQHLNSNLKVKLQKHVKDDIMILKLPYRYKKFELSVENEHNDLFTVYDIIENQILDVECVHACVSKQEYENILSTWKVNKITVKNVQ